MKTRQTLLVALLVTLLLSGVALAAATSNSYTLDWFTVDGGGGTSSSGGGYSVSGTAGQPDAGTLSGGGVYTLQGGFWAGAAAFSNQYLPLARR